MKYQKTNSHWPCDLPSAPQFTDYQQQQTLDRLVGLELRMEQQSD
ncbi:hypothetical protein P9127_05470 [Bacillus stercoris]|nr:MULTISPECIES: hypothetical protein [Bacillus]MEC3614659.1 hypothetical protein [Bacillus stercoris]